MRQESDAVVWGCYISCCMTFMRLESYISSIFSWHMDWKCTCCTDTDGWTEAVLIWQLQPGCGPQDRLFISAGTRQFFFQLTNCLLSRAPPAFDTQSFPVCYRYEKKRFRFAWQQSNAGSSFLIAKRKKLECRSQAHSAESRDGIQSSASCSYFPTIYVRRLSFSDSNGRFFFPKQNHYSPFC